MQITSSLKEYEKDLLELARLFYPKFSNIDEDVTILHSHINLEKDQIKHTFKVIVKDKSKTYEKLQHTLNQKLSTRKFLQIALYELLSSFTKRTLEWGAFIGIRPVKAVHDLIKEKESTLGALNTLKNTYYVNDKKLNLLSNIIDVQGYRIKNDSLVNLYVSIPFCISKCSYCSFMSSQIDKAKKLINPYVEALVNEINETKKFLSEHHYIVKNIYIGGGTPTALETYQLEPILKALSSYSVKEFTVEAGRVDTITKEKLDLFKKYKVNRISINPQTFNEEVLKETGRNHTIKDFLDIYKLALNYNFIINMDIIAGLKKETLKSFKAGINTLLELAPDNITIHTLSLKRASLLNKNKTNIFKKPLAQKMLDYAYEKLAENGYKPYYLYRQKNMLENLENVGFCKDNKICEFNIDSIDEYTSILAFGAGGASKRVYHLENKKEQCFNVKGVKEYIERLDEMKARKYKLFS